ncbi:MAG TPA: tetratricopeptide repeat protein [Thermodesulfovibrionales bacterium]|nr:tetratricopeptide repeat protein [Thermodesulfovibrionales bacterium]
MKNELYDSHQLGKELFEAGRYAEAESVLKDVIEQGPGYADVWNMLGVIAHLNGRVHEASSFFVRAVQLNPKYTEASLNLVIAYNDMGEFKKAQEVFFLAAKIAHTSPSALDPFAAGKLANEHYKIGNIYLDFGMLDEAIEEYRKALKLHGGAADICTKLGMALRSKGDYEEAVVQFTRAKESNPDYGQAWVQLGITYYMKGMIGLAFEEWERAAARNPNLKEATTYLKLFRQEEQ